MLPNSIGSLGTASLSAVGTLVPSSIGGGGTIDTQNTDWLAVGLLFGGTATVVVEGSWDGSTNWQALPIVTSAGAVATSVTASGNYIAQTLTPFTRLRVSAWTSGAVQLLGGSADIDQSPVTAAGSGTLSVQPTTNATPSTNGALAATTNATSVKTSAGTIGEIDFFNGSAGTVYLKLYNKASAPTVGTDIPVAVFPIAAGASFVQEFGPLGKRLGTGIAYATTGVATDSDTTVIAAGCKIGLTYI